MTGNSVFDIVLDQQPRNTSASISATDVEICQTRLGKKRRTQLVLTPVSAGVTAYVSFGDTPASTNTGIVLQPNQPLVRSTDAGSNCWQGAIHCVGSGAGTISIYEEYES